MKKQDWGGYELSLLERGFDETELDTLDVVDFININLVENNRENQFNARGRAKLGLPIPD
jgi:hypothetical protein